MRRESLNFNLVGIGLILDICKVSVEYELLLVIPAYFPLYVSFTSNWKITRK